MIMMHDVDNDYKILDNHNYKIRYDDKKKLKKL